MAIFLLSALMVCSSSRNAHKSPKGTPHLVTVSTSTSDSLRRSRRSRRPTMSSREHGNGPLVVQRHEGRRRRPRNEERQLHDRSQRQQFDCHQNGLFLPMSTRRQIRSPSSFFARVRIETGREYSAGKKKQKNSDFFFILERPRIGGFASVAVVMETKATNVSAAKFNYSVVAVPPAVSQWKCYRRENSTAEVNASFDDGRLVVDASSFSEPILCRLRASNAVGNASRVIRLVNSKRAH